MLRNMLAAGLLICLAASAGCVIAPPPGHARHRVVHPRYYKVVEAHPSRHHGPHRGPRPVVVVLP